MRLVSIPMRAQWGLSRNSGSDGHSLLAPRAACAPSIQLIETIDESCRSFDHQDEPLSAAALQVFIGNIIALPKLPGVSEGPMPSFEGAPMIELEAEAAGRSSAGTSAFVAEPEEVAYV